MKQNIQPSILKKTILPIVLIVFVITSLFFIPGIAQKLKTSIELYDSDIYELVDTFHYKWFSGTTKNYNEQITELRNLIQKYKKEATNQKKKPSAKALNTFNFATLLNGLLTYSIDRASALKLIRKHADMLHVRMHLWFSLHYPDYKGFEIKTFLGHIKEFKDYDYLWVGAYYLQRSDFANAKRYYTIGIQKTKKLLKAYDIMLEASSYYQRYKRLFRKTKQFISVLPYVRAEDAYFFMKDELNLNNFKLAVERASGYDSDDVLKSLIKGNIPIYKTNRFIYLTHGDVFLLCKTYLVMNNDLKRIKNLEDLDYLPSKYIDIASYLFKQRLIRKYLDGKVHIISPAQGPFVTKLFNQFKIKAGSLKLYYKPGIKILKDELGIDLKLKITSPRRFDVEKIEKNANENKELPVFIYRRRPYRNPILQVGDLYLTLHGYIIAKGKKEIVPEKTSAKVAKVRGPYKQITDFLLSKKIITQKDINVTRQINMIEYIQIIKSFKQRVKL